MILAEDIAIGRAEEYRSWCTQYNVPCVTLFTKEELGHIIGKPRPKRSWTYSSTFS